MEITRISADDNVFESPDYINDRLTFNYIESSRQHDNTELYSDKKHVIICRKPQNKSVWIWTDNDVHNDPQAVIAIAKVIKSFDAERLEFYTKPNLAQIFSDMYALISSDLDYRITSEFSLVAYKFTSPVNLSDNSVTVLKYSKKHSDALLDFYMELKDEFNWSEEKVRETVSKYRRLDTYLLLKNGQIVSVCAICNDKGDFSSVRSVATKATQRHKGYGSLVTNFAARCVSKNAKEHIMLYTNNANTNATATFKKAGFEYVGDVHLIKTNTL